MPRTTPRAMVDELGQYLDSRRTLVEEALKAAVPPTSTSPTVLHEAIHYSLFPGGKRIRPILALAAAEAVGGSIGPVLPICPAIEMIHAYSLVHDDLPAMDNADDRRGRPSTHRAFGEGVAILVGDALLTAAFTLLADRTRHARLDPEIQLAVIHELGHAIGSQGMVGGQAVDIQSQGRRITPETLHDIHTRKTGALIRASIRVGAIVARGDQAALRAVTVYGEKVGLAFQVADDLLDVNGAGCTDSRAATYPSHVGVEASQALARGLVDEAVAVITPLGPAADPLTWIARYVVDRSS